jgi:hypothetical protein
MGRRVALSNKCKKSGEFGVFGGVSTQIFRIKFGLFEQNDKKLDFSCCT